jgi:hypothetical protein
MPGNPKECREHAKDCLRRASTAQSRLAREQWEELAQTWLKLAASLESDQVLFGAMACLLT